MRPGHLDLRVPEVILTYCQGQEPSWQICCPSINGTFWGSCYTGPIFDIFHQKGGKSYLFVNITLMHDPDKCCHAHFYFTDLGNSGTKQSLALEMCSWELRGGKVSGLPYVLSAKTARGATTPQVTEQQAFWLLEEAVLELKTYARGQVSYSGWENNTN